MEPDRNRELGLKSARVIDSVKEMILRGDLRPGDRLPNEDEFALQLGVSRSSMREAVRALSAMQILTPRQGDGTYVSSLEPSQLLESLSFAVDIAGLESVLDFLEVRRILECHAAMAAAARSTEADLSELAEVHHRTLAATDPEILMPLDMQFHETISRIAGNSVLSALLRVVSSPTVRARVWRGRSEEKFGLALQREHGLILAAITRRDPQAAMVESYNHVLGVERWVRANVESGTIGAPITPERGD